MALTTCDHVKQIKITAKPDEVKGCDECLQMGGSWVEVRMCLTCGHVGCCDSSKHQHARKHYKTTQHRLSNPSSQGKNGAGATSMKNT